MYGTLMPGRLRWPLLAPPVSTRHRPAAVAGRMWDTGNGWPAARFTGPDGGRLDPGSGIVPGWLVEIDPAVLAETLAALDAAEGATDPRADAAGNQPADEDLPPDGYRRIVVVTEDGERAWAYEAVSVDLGWVPILAWTDRPEA